MFRTGAMRRSAVAIGAMLALLAGAAPAAAAPVSVTEARTALAPTVTLDAYPSIAFGNVIDVSTKVQFTVSATFTVAAGFYDYRWWADGKQARPIYQGNCWTGPTCTISVPAETFLNYTGAYKKLTLRVYGYSPSNIQVTPL
ncbi:hypothetical protein MRQ36_28730 [Micromonospora sp. R77]|uniref:hypothetical protein n=1 Tax=Micromonospora sp. R77 TaxID=2925836 RepID=UPI001F603226|nr:hypothetical protein [Micromonospora sp. R77]MCI4066323.1 hypothetical protein [Micromonospora sp. R77]